MFARGFDKEIRKLETIQDLDYWLGIQCLDEILDQTPVGFKMIVGVDAQDKLGPGDELTEGILGPYCEGVGTFLTFSMPQTVRTALTYWAKDPRVFTRPVEISH